MDDKQFAPRPSLLVIVNKVQHFNAGSGQPLSDEEETFLIEWLSISVTNAEIFDRLTNPDNYMHMENYNPAVDALRLGHYRLIRDLYFANIDNQKLRQDNDIIWLMTDHMVSHIPKDHLLPLRQWAARCPLNRSIYDRFMRRMAAIDKEESKLEEKVDQVMNVDSDMSWKLFQRQNYLPYISFRKHASKTIPPAFLKRKKT